MTADTGEHQPGNRQTQPEARPDQAALGLFLGAPPLHGKLSGSSILDGLPDAPLTLPPASGPTSQLPSPSSDVVMTEADAHVESPGQALQHDLQEHEVFLAQPATLRPQPAPQPAPQLTPIAAQASPSHGVASSELFMTEADLLVDNTRPNQASVSAIPSQPPEPSTSTHPSRDPDQGSHDSRDGIGEEAAPQVAPEAVHSQPAYQSSGASLAARAAQRQRAAAAAKPAAAPGRRAAAAPTPVPAPAPAAAPVVVLVAKPLRNMFTKDESYRTKPDAAKVPHETKIGALYALYCLYETQPGRVPVYLPMELLHQLLEVVKEAHAMPQCDVLQVVRQLMIKKAFVVGAVRRPPRGSAADEASLQPPNRCAIHILDFCLGRCVKQQVSA